MPARANVLCRSMQYVTGATFDLSRVLARKFRDKYYLTSFRGKGIEARGEQSFAKLRVICARRRTNVANGKTSRSDHSGLIKIFRTLPLLITSPRDTSHPLPFLFIKHKKNATRKEACADYSWIS